MTYTREQIAEAARKRGHTEEEVQRMLAQIDKLSDKGLLKKSADGSVAMTNAGRKTLKVIRGR